MKMTKTWRNPKYVTPKIPFTIHAVIGKLKQTINIPINARKKELRWNQRYKKTNASD